MEEQATALVVVHGDAQHEDDGRADETLHHPDQVPPQIGAHFRRHATIGGVVCAYIHCRHSHCWWAWRERPEIYWNNFGITCSDTCKVKRNATVESPDKVIVNNILFRFNEICLYQNLHNVTAFLLTPETRCAIM